MSAEKKIPATDRRGPSIGPERPTGFAYVTEIVTEVRNEKMGQKTVPVRTQRVEVLGKSELFTTRDDSAVLEVDITRACVSYIPASTWSEDDWKEYYRVKIDGIFFNFCEFPEEARWTTRVVREPEGDRVILTIVGRVEVRLNTLSGDTKQLREEGGQIDRLYVNLRPPLAGTTPKFSVATVARDQNRGSLGVAHSAYLSDRDRSGSHQGRVLIQELGAARIAKVEMSVAQPPRGSNIPSCFDDNKKPEPKTTPPGEPPPTNIPTHPGSRRPMMF